MTTDTWYAPPDKYKALHMLALERGSSVRQLMVSAVLHYYRDTHEFKDLVTDESATPRARA